MKNKSFTLIELLIVLVVIGILAVLAIPKFEVWAINSKGVEAKTILRAVGNWVWVGYIESGRMPLSQTGALPKPLPFNNIEVKFPSNTYFTYTYTYVPYNVVILVASNVDMFQNGPIGSIYQYNLDYRYDAPTINPGGVTLQGKKMDDHWYEYCYRRVKIRNTPIKLGRAQDGW